MDRVFRYFENYADENEHRRESNATRIKKVFKKVQVSSSYFRYFWHNMSGNHLGGAGFISDACQCKCH